MVDSVNSNVGKVSDPRVISVARVAQAPAPAAVTPEAQSAAVTTAAQTLSAKPPVNADRVRLIREAVETGTFPLSPATVADRLIALKYEWMSHD